MPLATAIIETIRAIGVRVEVVADGEAVVISALDADGQRYIVMAEDETRGAIVLAQRLGFELEE